MLQSTFDLITISFSAILLLLSLLSFLSIFLLRFKSRHAPHLLNFNSLWPFRFLLVTFISLWSLLQLLPLPFLRFRLCKFHLILSLGFLQPGFLIILLFLITVSIQKENTNNSRLIILIITVCFPLTFLQIFSLFFSPILLPLPEIFYRSSILAEDGFGNVNEICAFPLLSSIVFGVFGLAYLIWFLFSCFMAVNLAINKGLRIRICVLGLTVMISVVMEILFLVLSAVLKAEKVVSGAVSVAVFLSGFVCAAAGECILVIRPIADALAVGRDGCRWRWLPELAVAERGNHGREIEGEIFGQRVVNG